MKAEIRHAEGSLADLISITDSAKLNAKQMEMIRWCQGMSGETYTGWIDDKLVCAWGLIPPTLISDRAYLWMHATHAVEQHKFIFVRHSQRIVEQMLKLYPTIIGHCMVGSRSSIRWVQWLGGVFEEAEGPFLPFVIRS